MKYKIELCENWRPKGQFFTPGTYRVPEDFTEEMVAEASKAVRVIKISAKAPAPENKLMKAPENKKKPGPVKQFSSPPVARHKAEKT